MVTDNVSTFKIKCIASNVITHIIVFIFKGENTISVPRRKRSEGEIEESPRVNPEDIDVEQAGVLECLYDFFFGEGTSNIFKLILDFN